MGDKGEGQKFQKMGDVIMDDPILTTQKAFLLQKISFPFVQNEFQNSFFKELVLKIINYLRLM